MPQTRRPLSSGGDVQRRTRKSMGGIRPSRRAFRSCPGGPKKLDSGSARRRAGRVPRGGCGDNCLVCRTCVCQPGRDVAEWSAGGAGAAATKLRHGVFEHRLGSRWGPRAADVLVIGGGLAGGWAATAAVRAGARVVLLDKRYFGTSGVTATGGARTLVGSAGPGQACCRDRRAPGPGVRPGGPRMDESHPGNDEANAPDPQPALTFCARPVTWPARSPRTARRPSTTSRPSSERP
jgi:hypothetical protein